MTTNRELIELLELAERCEKATGPDQELDRAIQLAIRKPVPSDKWTGRDAILPQKPRHYTASLDTAMTLVPEGQESGIIHEAWSRLSDAAALHVRFWKAEDGSYAQALARFVTAAALRARASGEQ